MHTSRRGEIVTLITTAVVILIGITTFVTTTVLNKKEKKLSYQSRAYVPQLCNSACGSCRPGDDIYSNPDECAPPPVNTPAPPPAVGPDERPTQPPSPPPVVETQPAPCTTFCDESDSRCYDYNKCYGALPQQTKVPSVSDLLPPEPSKLPEDINKPGDFNSWKCPGGNCDKCGKYGFWDTECDKFIAEKGLKDAPYAEHYLWERKKAALEQQLATQQGTDLDREAYLDSQGYYSSRSKCIKENGGIAEMQYSNATCDPVSDGKGNTYYVYTTPEEKEKQLAKQKVYSSAEKCGEQNQSDIFYNTGSCEKRPDGLWQFLTDKDKRDIEYKMAFNKDPKKGEVAYLTKESCEGNARVDGGVCIPAGTYLGTQYYQLITGTEQVKLLEQSGVYVNMTQCTSINKVGLHQGAGTCEKTPDGLYQYVSEEQKKQQIAEFQTRQNQSAVQCQRTCEEHDAGRCIQGSDGLSHCVSTNADDKTLITYEKEKNCGGRWQPACTYTGIAPPTGDKRNYTALPAGDYDAYNTYAQCGFGLKYSELARICIPNEGYEKTQAVAGYIKSQPELRKDDLLRIIGNNLTQQQIGEHLPEIQKQLCTACGGGGECVYSDAKNNFACVSQYDIEQAYRDSNKYGTKGEFAGSCTDGFFGIGKGCNGPNLVCNSDNKCQLTEEGRRLAALNAAEKTGLVKDISTQVINLGYLSGAGTQNLSSNKQLAKGGACKQTGYNFTNGSCWECVDTGGGSYDQVANDYCTNPELQKVESAGRGCRGSGGYCAEGSGNMGGSDCPAGYSCRSNPKEGETKRDGVFVWDPVVKVVGLNQDYIRGETVCAEGLRPWNGKCQDITVLAHNDDFKRGTWSTNVEKAEIPLISGFVGGFLSSFNGDYAKSAEIRAAKAFKQIEEAKKNGKIDDNLGMRIFDSLDGAAKGKLANMVYTYVKEKGNIVEHDVWEGFAGNVFRMGNDFGTFMTAYGGDQGAKSTAFLDYAKAAAEINAQVQSGHISGLEGYLRYAGAAAPVGFQVGQVVADVWTAGVGSAVKGTLSRGSTVLLREAGKEVVTIAKNQAIDIAKKGAIQSIREGGREAVIPVLKYSGKKLGGNLLGGTKAVLHAPTALAEKIVEKAPVIGKIEQKFGEAMLLPIVGPIKGTQLVGKFAVNGTKAVVDRVAPTALEKLAEAPLMKRIAGGTIGKYVAQKEEQMFQKLVDQAYAQAINGGKKVTKEEIAAQIAKQIDEGAITLASKGVKPPKIDPEALLKKQQELAAAQGKDWLARSGSKALAEAERLQIIARAEKELTESAMQKLQQDIAKKVKAPKIPQNVTDIIESRLKAIESGGIDPSLIQSKGSASKRAITIAQAENPKVGRSVAGGRVVIGGQSESDAIMGIAKKINPRNPNQAIGEAKAALEAVQFGRKMKLIGEQVRAYGGYLAEQAAKKAPQSREEAIAALVKRLEKDTVKKSMTNEQKIQQRALNYKGAAKIVEGMMLDNSPHIIKPPGFLTKAKTNFVNLFSSPEKKLANELAQHDGLLAIGKDGAIRPNNLHVEVNGEVVDLQTLANRSADGEVAFGFKGKDGNHYGIIRQEVQGETEYIVIKLGEDLKPLAGGELGTHTTLSEALGNPRLPKPAEISDLVLPQKFGGPLERSVVLTRAADDSLGLASKKWTGLAKTNEQAVRTELELRGMAKTDIDAYIAKIKSGKFDAKALASGTNQGQKPVTTTAGTGEKKSLLQRLGLADDEGNLKLFKKKEQTPPDRFLTTGEHSVKLEGKQVGKVKIEESKAVFHPDSDLVLMRDGKPTTIKKGQPIELRTDDKIFIDPKKKNEWVHVNREGTLDHIEIRDVPQGNYQHVVNGYLDNGRPVYFPDGSIILNPDRIGPIKSYEAIVNGQKYTIHITQDTSGFMLHGKINPTPEEILQEIAHIADNARSFIGKDGARYANPGDIMIVPRAASPRGGAAGGGNNILATLTNIEDLEDVVYHEYIHSLLGASPINDFTEGIAVHGSARFQPAARHGEIYLKKNPYIDFLTCTDCAEQIVSHTQMIDRMNMFQRSPYELSYTSGGFLVKSIEDEYGEEGIKKFVNAYNKSRSRYKIDPNDPFSGKLFRADGTPIHNRDAIRELLAEEFGDDGYARIIARRDELVTSAQKGKIASKVENRDVVERITIGRDATKNSIVVEDPTDILSREHLTITRDKKGNLTLYDHSSNGTFLNGNPKPLERSNPTLLKEGDSFVLAGEDKFKFTIKKDADGKLVPVADSNTPIVAKAQNGTVSFEIKSPNGVVRIAPERKIQNVEYISSYKSGVTSKGGLGGGELESLQKKIDVAHGSLNNHAQIQNKSNPIIKQEIRVTLDDGTVHTFEIIQNSPKITVNKTTNQPAVPQKASGIATGAKPEPLRLTKPKGTVDTQVGFGSGRSRVPYKIEKTPVANADGVLFRQVETQAADKSVTKSVALTNAGTDKITVNGKLLNPNEEITLTKGAYVEVEKAGEVRRFVFRDVDKKGNIVGDLYKDPPKAVAINKTTTNGMITDDSAIALSKDVNNDTRLIVQTNNVKHTPSGGAAKPINPGEELILNHGDIVDVGNQKFTFIRSAGGAEYLVDTAGRAQPLKIKDSDGILGRLKDFRNPKEVRGKNPIKLEATDRASALAQSANPPPANQAGSQVAQNAPVPLPTPGIYIVTNNRLKNRSAESRVFESGVADDGITLTVAKDGKTLLVVDPKDNPHVFVNGRQVGHTYLIDDANAIITISRRSGDKQITLKGVKGEGTTAKSSIEVEMKEFREASLVQRVEQQNALDETLATAKVSQNGVSFAPANNNQRAVTFKIEDPNVVVIVDGKHIQGGDAKRYIPTDRNHHVQIFNTKTQEMTDDFILKGTKTNAEGKLELVGDRIKTPSQPVILSDDTARGFFGDAIQGKEFHLTRDPDGGLRVIATDKSTGLSIGKKGQSAEIQMTAGKEIALRDGDSVTINGVRSTLKTTAGGTQYLLSEDGKALMLREAKGLGALRDNTLGRLFDPEAQALQKVEIKSRIAMSSKSQEQALVRTQYQREKEVTDNLIKEGAIARQERLVEEARQEALRIEQQEAAVLAQAPQPGRDFLKEAKQKAKDWFRPLETEEDLAVRIAKQDTAGIMNEAGTLQSGSFQVEVDGQIRTLAEQVEQTPADNFAFAYRTSDGKTYGVYRTNKRGGKYIRGELTGDLKPLSSSVAVRSNSLERVLEIDKGLNVESIILPENGVLKRTIPLAEAVDSSYGLQVERWRGALSGNREAVIAELRARGIRDSEMEKVLKDLERHVTRREKQVADGVRGLERMEKAYAKKSTALPSDDELRRQLVSAGYAERDAAESVARFNANKAQKQALLAEQEKEKLRVAGQQYLDQTKRTQEQLAALQKQKAQEEATQLLPTSNGSIKPDNFHVDVNGRTMDLQELAAQTSDEGIVVSFKTKDGRMVGIFKEAAAEEGYFDYVRYELDAAGNKIGRGTTFSTYADALPHTSSIDQIIIPSRTLPDGTQIPNIARSFTEAEKASTGLASKKMAQQLAQGDEQAVRTQLARGGMPAKDIDAFVSNLGKDAQAMREQALRTQQAAQPKKSIPQRLGFADDEGKFKWPWERSQVKERARFIDEGVTGLERMEEIYHARGAAIPTEAELRLQLAEAGFSEKDTDEVLAKFNQKLAKTNESRAKAVQAFDKEEAKRSQETGKALEAQRIKDQQARQKAQQETLKAQKAIERQQAAQKVREAIASPFKKAASFVGDTVTDLFATTEQKVARRLARQERLNVVVGNEVHPGNLYVEVGGQPVNIQELVKNTDAGRPILRVKTKTDEIIEIVRQPVGENNRLYRITNLTTGETRTTDILSLPKADQIDRLLVPESFGASPSKEITFEAAKAGSPRLAMKSIGRQLADGEEQLVRTQLALGGMSKRDINAVVTNLNREAQALKQQAAKVQKEAEQAALKVQQVETILPDQTIGITTKEKSGIRYGGTPLAGDRGMFLNVTDQSLVKRVTVGSEVMQGTQIELKAGEKVVIEYADGKVETYVYKTAKQRPDSTYEIVGDVVQKTPSSQLAQAAQPKKSIPQRLGFADDEGKFKWPWERPQKPQKPLTVEELAQKEAQQKAALREQYFTETQKNTALLRQGEIQNRLIAGENLTDDALRADLMAKDKFTAEQADGIIAKARKTVTDQKALEVREGIITHPSLKPVNARGEITPDNFFVDLKGRTMDLQELAAQTGDGEIVTSFKMKDGRRIDIVREIAETGEGDFVYVLKEVDTKGNAVGRVVTHDTYSQALQALPKSSEIDQIVIPSRTLAGGKKIPEITKPFAEAEKASTGLASKKWRAMDEQGMRTELSRRGVPQKDADELVARFHPPAAPKTPTVKKDNIFVSLGKKSGVLDENGKIKLLQPKKPEVSPLGKQLAEHPDLRPVIDVADTVEILPSNFYIRTKDKKIINLNELAEGTEKGKPVLGYRKGEDGELWGIIKTEENGKTVYQAAHLNRDFSVAGAVGDTYDSLFQALRETNLTKALDLSTYSIVLPEKIGGPLVRTTTLNEAVVNSLDLAAQKWTSIASSEKNLTAELAKRGFKEDQLALVRRETALQTMEVHPSLKPVTADGKIKPNNFFMIVDDRGTTMDLQELAATTKDGGLVASFKTKDGKRIGIFKEAAAEEGYYDYVQYELQSFTGKKLGTGRSFSTFEEALPVRSEIDQIVIPSRTLPDGTKVNGVVQSLTDAERVSAGLATKKWAAMDEQAIRTELTRRGVSAKDADSIIAQFHPQSASEKKGLLVSLGKRWEDLKARFGRKTTPASSAAKPVQPSAKTTSQVIQDILNDKKIPFAQKYTKVLQRIGISVVEGINIELRKRGFKWPWETQSLKIIETPKETTTASGGSTNEIIFRTLPTITTTIKNYPSLTTTPKSLTANMCACEGKKIVNKELCDGVNPCAEETPGNCNYGEWRDKCLETAGNCPAGSGLTRTSWCTAKSTWAFQYNNCVAWCDPKYLEKGKNKNLKPVEACKGVPARSQIGGKDIKKEDVPKDVKIGENGVNYSSCDGNQGVYVEMKPFCDEFGQVQWAPTVRTNVACTSTGTQSKSIQGAETSVNISAAGGADPLKGTNNNYYKSCLAEGRCVFPLSALGPKPDNVEACFAYHRVDGKDDCRKITDITKWGTSGNEYVSLGFPPGTRCLKIQTPGDPKGHENCMFPL